MAPLTKNVPAFFRSLKSPDRVKRMLNFGWLINHLKRFCILAIMLRLRPIYRNALLLAVLLPAGLFMGGCFRKWTLSPQQIEQRFADKPLKPIPFAVDTLGRRLAWHQIGHDTLPLLLLIHGAPGSWYGYLNLMEDPELQRYFQMVSVDRPGYGASDYGHPLNSLEDQSRMLHAVLERYKHCRPIIVLGRSYGSPIAAQLAADYPELVDACVMLAPAIDPRLEKFWWFSPIGLLDGVRNLLPDALNVATDEKYSHRRELRKLEQLLPKISTPTTVIQGGDDDLVDPRNILYAEKMLQNAPARMVFIPGQSHHISRQRPDLVKKYVLMHLEEYRKPALVSSRGSLGGPQVVLEE